MTVKQEYLQKFRERFVLTETQGAYKGDNLILFDETIKELEQFLSEALDEQEAKIAEHICKMIDDIEFGYRNTTLEEWKAFKHIRNAIRDEYLLKGKA